MNKITRIGITAAVIVAAAGGSYAAYAAASSTPDTSSTAEVTSSPSPSITETATPTDSPTPSPSASPAQYTAVPNADAIFLKAMHTDGFLVGITIPTDDELLADGRTACDNLARGIAYDHMTVIAEDPNPPASPSGPGTSANSANLAGIASETLCTEYSIEKIPVVQPTNPN